MKPVNFLSKAKNWKNYLIGWLGGYSEAEFRMFFLGSCRIAHDADAEIERLKKKIRALEDDYRALLNIDSARVEFVAKMQETGDGKP